MSKKKNDFSNLNNKIKNDKHLKKFNFKIFFTQKNLQAKKKEIVIIKKKMDGNICLSYKKTWIIEQETEKKQKKLSSGTNIYK